MFRLICKKCGWFLDNCAMKPICPDCRSVDITILKGDLEEVDERSFEIIASKK